MAFTVFTVVVLLFMVVGCSASSTNSTDSVKTMYDVQSSHPTQTSATTTGHKHDHETTAIVTPVLHFLGNILNESSHVNIADKVEGREDEVAERATHFYYNVLGVSHKLREKKERKLLDGDEADIKSASGTRVTEGLDDESHEYLHDSVHDFVTAKVPGDITSAMTVKSSTGSSLNALYELYSLVSYVAAASDEEKTENKTKGSSSVHINALYSLYSLVTYVMDAHAFKNGGSREKYGGATLQVGRFSALYKEEQQINARLGETSSDSLKWTYYIVIALSVVAAVALMLVVAVCLIRYCRRTKVDSGVATRPIVKGVGSPAT